MDTNKKFVSDETKRDVAELIAFVETLPDTYRSATYETLIRRLLAPWRPPSAPEYVPGNAEGVSNRTAREFASDSIGGVDQKYNSVVRSFLARYGLEATLIESVAMFDGADFVYFRPPDIRPKARATVEWALLLALKRAVTDGEFAVSKGEIRDVCKEHQCYDDGNFAKTLREAKNYFSNPFSENDTRRRITPDGERELVAVLKKLAAGLG